MIELKNLSKLYRYDKKTIVALDNINLSIPSGCIFGIIGKSGAGKSTLIRSLNLLEKPSTGSVQIEGADLTALNPEQLRAARRQIGMIFQQFNLLNSKTVWQNIALPLQLTKQPKSEIDKIINELLELVELTDKKNHYPSQLSGGQKQRVAIARALVNHPKLLLCDEATSALDPQTTKSILNLLKNINQRLGITIVLITHELDVVKQICDRVAVIEHGKIIEEAEVTKLFTHPQAETTRQFIYGAIAQTLTDKLQKEIHPQPLPNSNPVLRIYFFGASASEPLMAALIRQFGFDINILSANIEMIKNETIGVMTVELIDPLNQFTNGLNYLREKGIEVEVVGYVKQVSNL
jgi:D-methionine transport system ATP-binding protein